MSVEKQNKNYTPGCALVGGGLFKEGVLPSVLYGVVFGVCLSAEKPELQQPARFALEPNSSATLEIHAGTRAGGLRWCVAVRRSDHEL